jgi:hypothetical protein
MKPAVYIDSTIPSLYFDERPASAYRHEQTRLWWDTQRHNFDCYTSYFTEWETLRREYPRQNEVVAMVRQLPLLEQVDEIKTIIDVYIKNFVMPNDTFGDAAHLAMASYHGVDYLLTWNCTHLANAFKTRHIEKINLTLGMMTPLLVTPEQLFPEDKNA